MGFYPAFVGTFCRCSFSARLILCARCDSQVFLYRHCDRGNWYCGKTCSLQHALAQRESRQRHARTRRGRLDNAERQRRHRARLASHNRNKVTDQGLSQLRYETYALVHDDTLVETHGRITLTKGTSIFGSTQLSLTLLAHSAQGSFPETDHHGRRTWAECSH